jgi:hypothetical protein
MKRLQTLMEIHGFAHTLGGCFVLEAIEQLGSEHLGHERPAASKVSAGCEESCFGKETEVLAEPARCACACFLLFFVYTASHPLHVRVLRICLQERELSISHHMAGLSIRGCDFGAKTVPPPQKTRTRHVCIDAQVRRVCPTLDQHITRT